MYQLNSSREFHHNCINRISFLYIYLLEMGGHGGLNILPQKKWNVYNYDNRDIVDKDKQLHAEKLRK